MPFSIDDDQVLYEVAVLEYPHPGFAVVRIDLRVKNDDGQLLATIQSLHDSREIAHTEAHRLAGRLN